MVNSHKMSISTDDNRCRYEAAGETKKGIAIILINAAARNCTRLSDTEHLCMYIIKCSLMAEENEKIVLANDDGILLLKLFNFKRRMLLCLITC